jgi:DNA-binding response OmpR family regulator
MSEVMNCRGSILLVDDEETFRESTCRLLRREGFECFAAADADEAVAALQGSRFDLLIADIRMPGNPDLRVVRAAREVDSQMPVVLVTGYPTAETAIRGIDLSVVSYLTKPLDFDELLRHVKSSIDRCQTRRALSAVRERLQTCVADLETAESRLLSRTDRDVEIVSIGTIRTLAACLSELLGSGARSGKDRRWPNLCELLDCPQQPEHRRAIVEAIDVLKKTKETFKSKTLAELRTKLEDLVGPSDGLDCQR